MTKEAELTSQKEYLDHFYPMGYEKDPVLPDESPVLPSTLMHEVLHGHYEQADRLARREATEAAETDGDLSI